MNPFTEAKKQQAAASENPFTAAKQAQGPANTYSSAIFPVTRDYSKPAFEGGLQFDSDAGLVGMVKRAFMLPGEVMRGEVDPLSDEGIGRATEMALTVSPMTPSLRNSSALAGSVKLPGKVKPKVPTSDELKAAATPVYKQLDKAGTEFSAKSVDDLSAAIQNELLQKRAIGAEDAPKTFTTLRNLQNAPEGATVPYATGLNTARKQLSRRSAKPDLNNPGDPTASAYAARRIMQYFEDDAGQGVVAGPSVPADLLRKANRNYAAAKRSETLTGKLTETELKAASANSGRNSGNALRQRIAGLLTNKGSARDRFGFTKKELRSLEQVSEGSRVANLTRDIGNSLGGGGGLGNTLLAGAAGGAGYSVAGYPGAVVGASIPVVAGRGIREVSNALTKGALKKVAKQTRKRSPLYEDLLSAAPQRQLPFDAKQALAKAALIEALLMQREDAQP